MSLGCLFTRSILFFITIGMCIRSLAQVPPVPSIRPPVDHPIRLSGTFGELRGNHFHGGLDIKSAQGTWGDPVYAIDDGYVSRISVSASGYGRALYLNHPASGLTSVYGHLQDFAPEIEQFVLEQQKQLKSFGVDIKPNEQQFRVRKGDQIGRMGSTGYSFGPHLHFEIRDIRTERTYNPQSLDLGISDSQKPVIRSYTIYQLDHQLLEYNRQQFPFSEKQTVDTLVIDAWRIGIGVEAFDPHNGGRNKNGIFSGTITVDQDTVFRLKMDSLNVDDGNYFNAHIDYSALVEEKRKVHRFFHLPTDHLSVYKASDGIIPLFRDRIQKIVISVSDFFGNEEKQTFFIKRAEQVTSPISPVFQYHVRVGIPDTITTPYLKIFMPPKALYQDLYLQYGSEPVATPGVFSAQYRLDRDRIPLHQPVELAIRPFPYPPTLRSKLTIVRVKEDGTFQFCASRWDSEWLRCNIYSLGKFQIVADTISPTIKLTSHKANSQLQIFQFTVKDNLPSSQGLKYHATLNGQWVLAEYDLKNDQITCRIPASDWQESSYDFKLLVEDPVGNKTSYDYRLNFK